MCFWWPLAGLAVKLCELFDGWEFWQMAGLSQIVHIPAARWLRIMEVVRG